MGEERPKPTQSTGPVTVPISLNELAAVLVKMGCPQAKALEMAAQLDKRARQLTQQTGRTYEEALEHLLTLMRQGWAAKEQGL